MTAAADPVTTLTTLDDRTRDLVRLSAGVAAGAEGTIRQLLSDAARGNVIWVEEVLLQSYLFAGFPRALNAMRIWRRLSGRPAVLTSENHGDVAEWRELGERTCQRVYGAMYDRLRQNILDLHPELDEWMIVEGYGKVLSRPGLDLARRELCIVSACAASGQERQLHSHLHGALNVGVAEQVVTDSIEALESLLDEPRLLSTRLLWARVRGK